MNKYWIQKISEACCGQGGELDSFEQEFEGDAEAIAWGAMQPSQPGIKWFVYKWNTPDPERGAWVKIYSGYGRRY
jgi:hypothetical protein